MSIFFVVVLKMLEGGRSPTSCHKVVITLVFIYFFFEGMYQYVCVMAMDGLDSLDLSHLDFI